MVPTVATPEFINSWRGICVNNVISRIMLCYCWPYIIRKIGYNHSNDKRLRRVESICSWSTVFLCLNRCALCANLSYFVLYTWWHCFCNPIFSQPCCIRLFNLWCEYRWQPPLRFGTTVFNATQIRIYALNCVWLSR